MFFEFSARIGKSVFQLLFDRCSFMGFEDVFQYYFMEIRNKSIQFY